MNRNLADTGRYYCRLLRSTITHHRSEACCSTTVVWSFCFVRRRYVSTKTSPTLDALDYYDHTLPIGSLMILLLRPSAIKCQRKISPTTYSLEDYYHDHTTASSNFMGSLVIQNLFPVLYVPSSSVGDIR